MYVPREERLKELNWYYFFSINKQIHTKGCPPFELRLLRRNEVMYYRRQPLCYRLLVKAHSKVLKDFILDKEGFYICKE